jgi:mannose/fructose/N-acetylgalactosamine-specific phosphotransferase system component IIC
VLAAKLVVGVLVGLAFGLIAEGLMTGDASALAVRGIDNKLGAGDYPQLFSGGAAAAALWAAAGVGIGALVRNQVGALVGLCAWSTVRVRQMAYLKRLQIDTLLLFVARTRGHIPDTSAVRATHGDVSRRLPTRR